MEGMDSFYNRIVKRGMDILLSGSALILLSPLFAATGIAIRLDSAGPVIFRQKRLGYHGKVFEMYKFRSMIDHAEHKGSGVYSGKWDSRVTRVGKIIRASSIDELPQCVNILKGEMSMIGPRPPLTYHPWPLSEYTEQQKHMFDVRPGLTGWAQVHGRREVEWHKRIELNNWYADHVSFPLDLKIFFLTIGKVLNGSENENISETVIHREDSSCQ